MNKASRTLVENIVDYIENNLKHPLSLDEMSSDISLSKFHLHHIFKSLTGLPLMTYVRGRKLTNSLSELLFTNMNVIDIACEYGFEYEQSYERAFRRQFGIYPADYRKKRNELTVVNKFDTNLLSDTALGILVKPYYAIRPTFHLIGKQILIIHEENRNTLCANKFGREVFNDSLVNLNYNINKDVYYGLCLYTDDPNYANYYMPSVEIEKAVNPEPPLLCHTIPTSLYAVFRYVGFHAPEDLNIHNIGEIYNIIDYSWPAYSSDVQSERYHFERMDLRRCSSDYCEADIYIPVKGQIDPAD